jgi:TP53 regulating kinase-like protein
LIKKGAEADIYLAEWYDKKAISKIRLPKAYRNKVLDEQIRKQRTIHEAKFLSYSKLAGVISPFVYFVDSSNAEIIMQFIEGKNVKDVITTKLSFEIGKYAALLHRHHIIHGDLTTSNFIFGDKLVLVDYGLSYYSYRLEDKATDVRLIKQVLSSAHVPRQDELFYSFINGYLETAGESEMHRVLDKVSDIETRGRYARPL